jgi:hypothetical protein
MFLGSIEQGDEIPISLTFDVAPTGTPTYEIIDSSRTEIVAAANLTQGASTLEWYKTGQNTESDATVGEYQIKYTAVVNGTTRYAYDTYEVISDTTTTTSGNADWTQTRADMIQSILEITGAIHIGGTPTSAQTSFVSRELNQYIKWLQRVYKLKLWKLEQKEYVFSSPDEVTGTDGSVYTCIKSHTSNANRKPVTGSFWTSYWKKKGSTGGVWATATSYSSSGDFTADTDTIGIERAYYRKNGSDIPIEVIGYDEYIDISDKISFGNPSRIWFDNRLSPTIYVHPQIEDVSDVVIHYLKIARIEDFDAGTDTPDFPVEWIEPIVWQVAHKVCFHYHVDKSRRDDIKRKADEYLREIRFSTKEYADTMRIRLRRR